MGEKHALLFECFFFSQNALRGFTEPTVCSAACARTEQPVTRATGSVCAPAGGWVQPASWVRAGRPVAVTLSWITFAQWEKK